MTRIEVGKTLYDKIWESHVVAQQPDHPAILYVDMHLVQETTYLQAFDTLRARGLPVRRLPLTYSVTDHSVPTRHELRFGPLEDMPYTVKGLLDAAEEFGMTVFGPNDRHQGIVHVIGPELALTQPGMVLVCADSHTSTHGALGALAIGIGTTEVGHAVAAQALLQRKQKALRVRVDGTLAPGVFSKDLALHLLAEFGTAFGRGHVIEFAGSAVEALSIEARMSLCNMSIEMGSRSGLVAPDDTTFAYLEGREFAPTVDEWERAVAYWRSLVSDPDAVFDREIEVQAADVSPMVTYGTNPGMAVPVDGRLPDLSRLEDSERAEIETALDYMGLTAGEVIAGRKVNTVFIGSCTNSRIEDMREAALVLRGRTIAAGTQLKVVPGSQAVKRQAEEEGLHEVFTAAGGAWGEPSCSLCVAVNGDVGRPSDYIASTSNRNFQGRQGPGVRTLLMSPMTAAATAVAGAVADPRQYL
jgi:3-isopropylmalate/(R)-2-methylmalate dehydratase large subunit